MDKATSTRRFPCTRSGGHRGQLRNDGGDETSAPHDRSNLTEPLAAGKLWQRDQCSRVGRTTSVEPGWRCDLADSRSGVDDLCRRRLLAGGRSRLPAHLGDRSISRRDRRQQRRRQHVDDAVPAEQGHALGLACSDPLHAWAVGSAAGSHPLILATSDGGATWVRQGAGLDHAALSAVTFSDARHGWTVGHISSVTGWREPSFVLATSDGGRHWREVYRTNHGRLFGIAASDRLHSWAVGSSAALDAHSEYAAAYIVATNDGGTHWKTQSAGRFEGLFDVTFADRLHGWAVGYKGTILATSDGGPTWAMQHSGPDLSMESVACTDASRAWAIAEGTSTLYSTRDGGATWTAIRLTTPGRFGFWALSVPVADRAR